MKHIAAYLLVVLGGKENPTKKDVIAVFESLNIEYDNERLDKLFEELKGKNLEEIIASGRAKLSVVSVGGGSKSTGGSVGSTGGGKVTEKEPEKEPEPEPEPVKEESGEDMGFSFFDQ